MPLDITHYTAHETHHNGIQHKGLIVDTQHDIQPKRHSIATHFIKCYYAQGRDLLIVMLNVVMLNVVMLNVVMLNVVMLNVVMLNVVMLNVVMLNVVMLNVVMSTVMAPK